MIYSSISIVDCIVNLKYNMMISEVALLTSICFTLINNEKIGILSQSPLRTSVVYVDKR